MKTTHSLRNLLQGLFMTAFLGACTNDLFHKARSDDNTPTDSKSPSHPSDKNNSSTKNNKQILHSASTTILSNAFLKSQLTLNESIALVSGLWYTNCRPIDPHSTNKSSEVNSTKDLITINDNQLILQTFHFPGSTDCSYNLAAIVSKKSFSLSIENGDDERNAALSEDILSADTCEKPQSLLLLNLTSLTEEKSGRVVAEIINDKIFKIRFNLYDWIQLLPERFNHYKDSLEGLESYLDSVDNIGRNIPYSKALVLSKATEAEKNLFQSNKGQE